jgi:tRNA(Arg) A34 adenosine deaminase TadA
MNRAIELAKKNVDRGGGPFGAIIVKDGEIISEASNLVTLEKDPTAHAEIVAIRKASEKLGTHELNECVLYATCEPCPMCLGAIYWARISQVYYAAERSDAASAGFDDSYIYEEIEKPIEKRDLPMKKILDSGVEVLFQKWDDKTDKQRY